MILGRNNRYFSDSPFTSFILLLASTPEPDPQCEPHDADGGRQNNDFGRSDTIGARYRNHKPLPSAIAITIAAVPPLLCTEYFGTYIFSYMSRSIMINHDPLNFIE